MNEKRSPDELLKAIKSSDNKAIGKLHIFLGMCSGVGKTYAMLEAAKHQAVRGTAIKVGVVETHGRKETEELLQGLTIIPKREMEYRGSLFYEMDLDSILAEKPELVLVDELAHTNVPGSRHAKRYQDVQEILKAGIDVYTTLNIQHVESRNDQVTQIAEVVIRERVPDSILEKAEQIEIVDIPPAELLRRLDEGKVYLGERAKRAKEGFFKEETLLALRELALRFVAEKVDQDLHISMTINGIAGPWSTNERLLVAISSSPSSARLIRTARRMAFNLEAPWIALYVKNSVILSADDEIMLEKNIALARELGAEVLTIADHNLARAIQKVSNNRNVTQIVIGRPKRRFLRDYLRRGSLLDKLLKETSKVDIHVIRAVKEGPKRFLFLWPQFSTPLFTYANTALFLIGISFLCAVLLPILGYRALGSLFLLSILVVASFSNAGPILFAAIFSAIVWNFFFIPPIFTFIINSTEDLVMLLSFFVVALVAGFLTSRIRQQEIALNVRENETRLLYEMVKKLSVAENPADVCAIITEIIQFQFKAKIVVLLADQSKKLVLKKDEPNTQLMHEKEMAVAQWSFENRQHAGWSTQTLSGASCLCLPMIGNSLIVGIVAYFPVSKNEFLGIEKRNFLETVITQSTIVLDHMTQR